MPLEQLQERHSANTEQIIYTRENYFISALVLYSRSLILCSLKLNWYGGVAGVLILVFGGGITLYVVWSVVISVAWSTAFGLVRARN